MKTPLRASFGIAPNPDGGKYGSMGAGAPGVKTVDREQFVPGYHAREPTESYYLPPDVQVKRPSSPSGSASRRGSLAATPFALSRKNTIESESDYAGSPRNTNGAYLVEVGSQEDRPRIWGHADFARISENPAMEAKAEEEAQARAAGGSGENGNEEEGEDGERRPLLSRIGKMFSNSNSGKSDEQQR